MNRFIVDTKKITILIKISYILTLFILIAQWTDFFPFGFVLQSIRYIYILLTAFYFLYFWNGYLEKKFVILISILLLHTFLYGTVFVNQNVLLETRDYFKEMMIFLGMVSFTFLFYHRHGSIISYIRTTYYTLSSIMMLCLFTHLSSCVNPLYFIYIFSSRHSYRSTFGFSHANFTGNYLVFILIYSFFLLDGLVKELKVAKRKNLQIEIIGIIILDILMLEMLFSTQSRTSIISGIIFILVYFYEKIKRRIPTKVKFVCILLLFVSIIILGLNGTLNTIWENSNRMENVEINMIYFRQFSPWTGMGYIPSYGFLLQTYGLPTFALDMYYLYIFFSTGYLGTILITIFLILSLVYIFKIKNIEYRNFAKAIFLAILFTGLGSSHMITNQLMTSMTNWTLIFLLISSNNSNSDEVYFSNNY